MAKRASIRPSNLEELVKQLSEAPLFQFSDWPCPDLPRVASGVYAVFDSSGAFLYIGMAGANLEGAKTEYEQKPGKRSGLLDRLNSHATGHRSGDRFNVYIGDLFVLERLTAEEIRAISNQELSFDSLIRDFIRKNLSYRFIVTAHTEVRPLESFIQTHGIDGTKPSINPRD